MSCNVAVLWPTCLHASWGGREIDQRPNEGDSDWCTHSGPRARGMRVGDAVEEAVSSNCARQESHEH
jgi:hypothetical protein